MLSSRFTVPAFAAMHSKLFVVAVLFATLSCRPPESPPSLDPARLARSGPLVAEPARLAVGAIPRASRVVSRVNLRNVTDAKLTVGRILTSCDCLSVTHHSTIIGPGDCCTTDFVLDLTAQPNYKGALLLTAEVQDESLATICTIEISVAVVD